MTKHIVVGQWWCIRISIIHDLLWNSTMTILIFYITEFHATLVSFCPFESKNEIQELSKFSFVKDAYLRSNITLKSNLENYDQ